MIGDFEFGADYALAPISTAIRFVETDVGVNVVAGLLTNHLVGVDISLLTPTNFPAEPLV